MSAGAGGSGYAQAAGATLQAGAAIGGAYLNYRASKRQGSKNRKHQRNILQNQISWRVKDAKNAGIHPLYALGMSPAASSAPVPVSGLGDGIAEAGQHIGGAVSRMASKSQKKEEQLRLALLSSQIGESDARKNLLESEAARNRQNTRSMVEGGQTQLGVMQENGATLPNANQKAGNLIFKDNPAFIYESDLNNRTSSFPPQLRDLPGAGIITKEPSEVKTHKKGSRGIIAGEHPGFKEYRLPNGLPILLPESDSMSEALEEVPMFMYKSIYELNKRQYGENWGSDFIDFLWKGKGPSKRPSQKSRRKAREWFNK